MKTFKNDILYEVNTLISKVTVSEEIIDKITHAAKVYIKGCGRTGLIMNMFAMRLVQMGVRAFVVGENITPHADAGDLLIIGSGSGETESLIAVSSKARKIGMEILLFTAADNSTLAGVCQNIVLLPARSKFASGKEKETIQPMGALFEQGLLVILEDLVLQIMEKNNITNESMQNRHANLE